VVTAIDRASELAGEKNLLDDDAAAVGGRNHSHATADLFESIAKGDYPEWQLCIQMMQPADEHAFDFDPLDVTKVWPEDLFPLQPVGRMVRPSSVVGSFYTLARSTLLVSNRLDLEGRTGWFRTCAQILSRCSMLSAWRGACALSAVALTVTPAVGCLTRRCRAAGAQPESGQLPQRERDARLLARRDRAGHRLQRGQDAAGASLRLAGLLVSCFLFELLPSSTH
jgi:Catalase